MTNSSIRRLSRRLALLNLFIVTPIFSLVAVFINPYFGVAIFFGMIAISIFASYAISIFGSYVKDSACPYCLQPIHKDATVCHHCLSGLEGYAAESAQEKAEVIDLQAVRIRARLCGPRRQG